MLVRYAQQWLVQPCVLVVRNSSLNNVPKLARSSHLFNRRTSNSLPWTSIRHWCLFIPMAVIKELWMLFWNIFDRPSTIWSKRSSIRQRSVIHCISASFPSLRKNTWYEGYCNWHSEHRKYTGDRWESIVRQRSLHSRKTDDIIIRCSTPEFVSRIGRKDLSGKEYHLSSVSAEIARSRGKKIESNEVLLLDDDVQNILIAQNVGHRVCHIDDDVDLDVLKQLVADILCECESRLWLSVLCFCLFILIRNFW